MADKFISIETDDENGATKRLKDMGDGTHAEVVSAQSGGAGSGTSKVNTLARPTVARVIPLSAALNTGLVLTADCERISMRAKGGDALYRLGTAENQVTAPTHFIGDGERMDLGVLPGAVLYATGTGELKISELV